MSFYGSVNETIVDGVSNLSSSGDPSVLVVGPSVGATGEDIQILGVGSNLDGLGEGKLRDRVADVLSTASSSVSAIVCPVEGNILGYSEMLDSLCVGDPTYAIQSGDTVKNDRIIWFEVTVAGGFDVAQARLSEDGGVTFQGAEITLTETLVLADGELSLVADDPLHTFVVNDRVVVHMHAPTADSSSLFAAIDAALELYTPEFIYVAQATDDVFWSSADEKADALFTEHRPTWFLCETEEQTYADFLFNPDSFVNDRVAESQLFRSSYVSLVAQTVRIYADGVSMVRSAGGITAGTVTKARVNQSIGEVVSFSFGNVDLPKNWTDASARTLDDAGFVTFRRYPGLSSVYITNGRMMAESTSDYLFIEIVRTTYKAIQLCRQVSLKYLQRSATQEVVAKLTTDLSQAVAGMANTYPPELESYSVIAVTKSSQEIATNGMTYEIHLYGLPVIRQIDLYFTHSFKTTTEG